MTLQEQINMLLSDKQRKKKFSELKEQDWLGAQSVIDLLSRAVFVKEYAKKLKANAGTAMYEVLVTKQAEAMQALQESDMTSSENIELLERWLKNCLTYYNNIEGLKLAVQKNGDGGANSGDSEDYDENDFMSPEKMAGR